MSAVPAPGEDRSTTHGPLSVGDGLAIIGIWGACVALYVFVLRNSVGFKDAATSDKLGIIPAIVVLVMYFAPFVTAFYLSKLIITRVNPED